MTIEYIGLNILEGEFMKFLILLALTSTLAFAGETKTECPWMKESASRQNPKANLEAKTKVKPQSSQVSDQ